MHLVFVGKFLKVVDTDEHPRPDASGEKMAGLRPVFKKEGVVTAANASGICDGAGRSVFVGGGRFRSTKKFLGHLFLARCRGEQAEGSIKDSSVFSGRSASGLWYNMICACRKDSMLQNEGAPYSSLASYQQPFRLGAQV